MESRLEEVAMNGVFFITGAESTGKSTLTEQLALHFGAVGVPEYAREYLQGIQYPYSYEDVEHIARKQVSLIHQYNQVPLVFFDTCLFNLKVWFREVYREVPAWLESEISLAGRGTYLLCEPDIPWQFDPLRENPDKRDYLSDQYEAEIGKAGFDYYRIFGQGSDRTAMAVEIVTRLIEPDKIV